MILKCGSDGHLHSSSKGAEFPEGEAEWRWEQWESQASTRAEIRDPAPTTRIKICSQQQDPHTSRGAVLWATLVPAVPILVLLAQLSWRRPRPRAEATAWSSNRLEEERPVFSLRAIHWKAGMPGLGGWGEGQPWSAGPLHLVDDVQGTPSHGC